MSIDGISNLDAVAMTAEYHLNESLQTGDVQEVKLTKAAMNEVKKDAEKGINELEHAAQEAKSLVSKVNASNCYLIHIEAKNKVEDSLEAISHLESFAARVGSDIETNSPDLDGFDLIKMPYVKPTIDAFKALVEANKEVMHAAEGHMKSLF